MLPERIGRARAPRILVIEPAEARMPLTPMLERLGWEVFTAIDARDARFACDVLSSSPSPPLATIADVANEAERHEVLVTLAKSLPGIPVLVVADDASAPSTIAGVETLRKPINAETLLASLTRVLRQDAPASDRRPRTIATEMIGDHESIAKVLKLVSRVAPTISTVLLLGETGTGKEVVARTIHALSPRRDGPMIAVNCAAIPEQLLETELFGHERGAFTGAVGRKTGLFERARGGTLFLDEIGDLPLSLQPKLLRALQEREILPVGATMSVPVDARIIVATHKDLAERCRAKEFREDLYYRLNVFPIHLPALRDRRSDIPLLADHFLRQLAAESGMPPRTLSTQALDCLVQYGWPGNVRELRSVLERASLMSENEVIDAADLPAEVRSPVYTQAFSAMYDFRIPDQGFVLEDFERALLLQAMERSNGVVAVAARLLGVSYRTLQYRLQKLRDAGSS